MPDATTLTLVATMAKLALRATGHSDSADAIADVMGAGSTLGFRGRLRTTPFHHQISKDLEGLRESEFASIQANDWEAACLEVAAVLERMGHAHALDAVVDPEDFHRSAARAGAARRRSLGGEAAQQAFDLLLKHAVDKLAEFMKSSPRFQNEAATRLLQESAALISQVDLVLASQTRVAEDIERLLSGATFGLTRLDEYANRRILTDPSQHAGVHIGRAAEVEQIEQWALGSQGRSALLVSAPGGRGKTRLCTEALLRITAAQPNLPIWVVESVDTLNGYVLSALDEPCVVYVDDAHRHPHVVEQLVNQALTHPGLRLLMSARPQAVDQLRRSVTANTGGAVSWVIVPLQRLQQAQSRRLVDAMLAGSDYGAPTAFRRWLIQQARKEPYLPVHAIDLFRQGKLAGALAVQEDLRDRVVSRHFEAWLPVVDGVSRPQVQRLLAALHALSTARTDLKVAAEAALDFADVGRSLRVALLAELEASGLLERVNDRLEVVPEIVGDYALELEARFDAPGFVRTLWEELGPIGGWPVFVSLCALDWRLREQGTDGALDAIWSTVPDHLRAEGWWDTAEVLTKLDALPQMQPRRLADSLLELIDRALQAASTTDEQGGDEIAHLFAEPDALVVATSAVSLLCRCAATESSLLQRVLDAAWRVATHPRMQSTGAESVINTMVDQLGRPSTPSGGTRDPQPVAAWVRRTAATTAPEHLQLLLPLCKALMSKTERYSELVDEMRVVWGTRLVSPSQTREARDEIRAMAKDTIGRMPPLAATQLVKILVESARRATQGDDFDDVDAARHYEAAWQDDDHATLDLVAALLSEGTSPAIRRLARRDLAAVVGWSGTPVVGLRALEIATQLDNICGDDWAEVLLRGNNLLHDRRLQSRRGMPLPTLEEFIAEERARPTIKEELQALRKASDQAVQAASKALLELGSAKGIQTLSVAAQDIAAAAGAGHVQAFPLWVHVATTAPATQAADLTRALAECEHPYLDAGAASLMNAWLTADAADFFDWLEPRLGDMRVSLRRETARAITWGHTSDPRSGQVLETLLGDEDPGVRDEAVRALANEVRDVPSRGLARLLSAHPTVDGAQAALESVAPELPAWVSALDEEGLGNVLALLEAVGPGYPHLSALAIALLQRDPARVIDICKAHHQPYGTGLDHDLVQHLGEHLDDVMTLAFHGDPHAAAPFISHVATLPLPEDIRGGFATRMRTLSDGEAFTAALTSLSSLGSWPLRDPELALAVLDAATHLDPRDQRRVLYAVRSAMAPMSWTIDPHGASDELDPITKLAHEVRGNARYAALHESADATIQYIEEQRQQALGEWEELF